MEKENSVRIHRVGTLTTGFSMIVFGILFLLHPAVHAISYEVIFSMWPIILIGLGIELLLSNLGAKQIVYDKAAMLLLVFMTFFAMAMAVADVCMQSAQQYLSIF